MKTISHNACFKLGTLLLTAIIFTSLSPVLPADPLLDKPDQYYSGKRTFMDYCARCHGVNADGRGRVAPMYIRLRHPRPSNFTVGIYANRPSQYLTNVISEGGVQNQLSQFMPPFKGELSKTEIESLVYFIQQTAKHNKVLANR